MSDKILPQFMFQPDINEFKNSKIIGRLLECKQMLKDLIESHITADLETNFIVNRNLNSKM